MEERFMDRLKREWRMNGRERIMDRLIKKQWRMDGRKNYFYCRTMMEYRMDIRGNGKWMSTVD